MQYLRVLALALAGVAIMPAQSGHWEGEIQTPERTFRIVVDLAKNDKGEWMGAVSVPSQNAKGIMLEEIVVQEYKVQFTIKGVPGHQTFEGATSEDRKRMSGTFNLADQSLPFQMTRTGDAEFEPPAKSTPLAKDLEGDWEGTLDTHVTKLHVKLHLANGPDGGTGTIVSVDQGGTEIPIAAVTQKDSNLKLELPMIGGEFSGDVSADRKEIAGKWTQSTGTLPLTFKRPAKAPAPKP